MIDHGLISGPAALDGSGECVGVVSDSPNRDSSGISSSAGTGLALDRCPRVELLFFRILFKAFCVRLFLLSSKSFAILAPSRLRFALISSFCFESLDAGSLTCQSKSSTIYASPLSTSNLASSA